MATFHKPLPQSGFPKRLTLSILKVALIIFKSLETKTRVPFAPGDTWKQSTLLMYNGVLGSWPVSSRKLTARHLTALPLPDGEVFTDSVLPIPDDKFPSHR